MKPISFKSLIDEAISYNNTSINSLASRIEVNRTTLQHCIAGRRTLSYEKFEELMQCLNMPENLEISIREEFAKLYFGADDYRIINESMRQLRELAEFEKFNISAGDNFEKLAGYLTDKDSKYYCVSEKEAPFFNSLMQILLKELEVCPETGRHKFYTNFNITNDCLRLMFLMLLRSYPGVVDYKHIIITNFLSSEESDTIDSETADINSEIAQNVILNFLYQYEFAGFGYNTYNYVYNNSQTLAPLPYYLITSDRVLFFSEDLQLFVERDDTSTYKYMESFFDSMFKQALPFCKDFTSLNNYSYFTSLDVTTNHDMLYYELSPNICLALTLDKQIIDESLPAEIPNRTYYVNGLSSFFSGFAKNPAIAISSLDSIMDFVSSDEEYCSYKYVTFDILRISPKNKYKMLKKYLEIVDSGNLSCYFYPNDRLQMPEYFHTCAFTNGFIWGHNVKILNLENGVSSSAAASIYNPILGKHLRNLTEYITHSNLINSNAKTFAHNHIKNAILYYKDKHGFED